MGTPGGPGASEGGRFQSVQDFLRFSMSKLIDPIRLAVWPERKRKKVEVL